MRLRVLGAAAVFAACALPQSPASAVQCVTYGWPEHIVSICDVYSNRPTVCFLNGEFPGHCFQATTEDLCIFVDGEAIICPPIVWPPV